MTELIDLNQYGGRARAWTKLTDLHQYRGYKCMTGLTDQRQ